MSAGAAPSVEKLHSGDICAVALPNLRNQRPVTRGVASPRCARLIAPSTGTKATADAANSA